jgi:uncharacterized membrane protein
MALLSDDNRRRLPELTTGDRVPLHPALTDVPVATLSLAPVFDAIALVTGSQSAGAAGLWTGATAVLWALPTAATGTIDYLRAESGTPVKRIGLAHAALNTFAVSMMAGALISRRFRSAPTPLSLLFSAAAGAAITYSSHLGGIMVYREGMRVSAAAPSGRATAPVDERAMGTGGGPAALSPLGGGGSVAATIGGVAEDSPDTRDAGFVAASSTISAAEEMASPLDVAPPPIPTEDLLTQTPGREQWGELDRLESAVEADADGRDDVTLDEGGRAGGELTDEERGEETSAA